MEIEKLIEAIKLCGSTPSVYQCKQCAYWAGGDMSQCIPRMAADVADTLEQLQAENDRLKDELEKVEAERDAAVNDLNILRKRSGWKCYACFYDDHYDRGVCAGCGYNNDNNWQWRGQKED